MKDYKEHFEEQLNRVTSNKAKLFYMEEIHHIDENNWPLNMDVELKIKAISINDMDKLNEAIFIRMAQDLPVFKFKDNSNV